MKLRAFPALLRRRVRYRITRAGWFFAIALAATGAGAFLTANNLLFLIFSAMLALLLVSGLLSRLVLAGLELELLLPEHVSARTPAPARIRLRNLKILLPSFSIELAGRRDPLTNQPPILTSPVYFPLIAGRQTVEAQIEVTFPHRGRHKENLFVLSTHFPFGFLRKTTTVSLRRETTVYPAIHPHHATELALDNLTGELESLSRGLGHEFHSIRPYEPHDNARDVDWKTSAHTGRLQVREFARDQQRTVEIFLDRRIANEQAWFEQAVESCAWLVWNLTGLDVEILFRSQRHAITLPDQGDVYDILRFLALVEPIRYLGDVPLAEEPADETSYQIVFSAHPQDFPCDGWTGAVLSPGVVADAAANGPQA